MSQGPQEDFNILDATVKKLREEGFTDSELALALNSFHLVATGVENGKQRYCIQGSFTHKNGDINGLFLRVEVSKDAIWAGWWACPTKS